MLLEYSAALIYLFFLPVFVGFLSGLSLVRVLNTLGKIAVIDDIASHKIIKGTAEAPLIHLKITMAADKNRIDRPKTSVKAGSNNNKTPHKRLVTGNHLHKSPIKSSTE